MKGVKEWMTDLLLVGILLWIPAMITVAILRKRIQKRKQIQDCELQPYAKITKMDIERKKERVFLKGWRYWLEFVVYYSDGYCCRTDITGHMNYPNIRISLPNKQIRDMLESAIFDHNEAVRQKMDITLPPDYIPIYAPTQKPVLPRRRGFAEGRWICVCGQKNARTVQTCQKCGMSKSWSDQQK